MLVCVVIFFFFFSSRRRHTRSLCDWSSDVCSSDLGRSRRCQVGRGGRQGRREDDGQARPRAGRGRPQGGSVQRDRKSVVYGKSVDLGGRRIIKKKRRKKESRKYAGANNSANSEMRD